MINVTSYRLGQLLENANGVPFICWFDLSEKGSGKEAGVSVIQMSFKIAHKFICILTSSSSTLDGAVVWMSAAKMADASLPA